MHLAMLFDSIIFGDFKPNSHATLLLDLAVWLKLEMLEKDKNLRSGDHTRIQYCPDY